jgi:hypothetical protein
LHKQIRNFLTVGVAALAIIVSSAVARADGFYADVHGGATIPWNESARVSSDIAPASANAHTLITASAGWRALLRAINGIVVGRAASRVNLNSPSAKTISIELQRRRR